MALNFNDWVRRTPEDLEPNSVAFCRKYFFSPFFFLFGSLLQIGVIGLRVMLVGHLAHLPNNEVHESQTFSWTGALLDSVGFSRNKQT